jgi:sec-independent protein translocase protein TatA
MGGIGLTEIIVILLIVLLLFGAGRIADVGKGLGDAVKNMKKSLREADEEDAKQLPEKGKDEKTA